MSVLKSRRISDAVKASLVERNVGRVEVMIPGCEDCVFVILIPPGECKRIDAPLLRCRIHSEDVE